MRRTLLLALLAFPLAALGAPGPRSVTIHGGEVKLSDLFPGIPPARDAVLGAAPALGAQYPIGPRQIEAIARLYHIPPPADDREIIVKRPAYRAGRRVFLAALEKAMPAGTLGNGRRIVLGDFHPLLLGEPPERALRLESLAFGPARSFTARFAYPAPGGKPATFEIAGSILECRRVLVAAHALDRGQTIGPADVTEAWLPEGKADPAAMDDPAEAIGEKLVLPVAAGQPLLPRFLVRPLAVAKGAVIILSASFPNLRMQTDGVALSGGPVGAQIRVLNSASHHVVTALVTAPNQAEVEIGGTDLEATSAGRL